MRIIIEREIRYIPVKPTNLYGEKSPVASQCMSMNMTQSIPITNGMNDSNPKNFNGAKSLKALRILKLDTVMKFKILFTTRDFLPLKYLIDTGI